jgi:hypothetical protein
MDNLKWTQRDGGFLGCSAVAFCVRYLARKCLQTLKYVTKEGRDDSGQRNHQYAYLRKSSIAEPNPPHEGIQQGYGEHTQEGDHGFC